MMSDFLHETVEIISPYVACAVIFFALGAATILYLDRNYKQHIQCAACKKKMFSVIQDVESSNHFSESEQQNLAFMRHLVRTGRVTDNIH